MIIINQYQADYISILIRCYVITHCKKTPLSVSALNKTLIRIMVITKFISRVPYLQAFIPGSTSITITAENDT
jgi:hypothetical protein